MANAYLILSALTALFVLNAYFPIRREPFSVVSFTLGWPGSELALQNLFLGVVVTGLFAWAGAFSQWPSWVGLAVALFAWIGMIGLAASGHRASRLVVRALDQATGPDLGPVAVPDHPEWGRWWRLTQAVPLRGRATGIVRNVDYAGDGIHAHRLDIIRSKVAPPRGAPVMVYLHGGAWVIGDKREQGKPMMYELVARGWVCVTVNYRLSPKATWPDHIEDCLRAIAWVKQHIAEYGGDPAFVALSGGSAGGHLAALAALAAGDPAFQPGFESADTSVQACIPFYGVMDLTGEASGSGRYGPGLLRLLERRVMKVRATEDPEVFRQASPTFRVGPQAPPFFVLHGRNDTLVPIEVARHFVTALREVTRETVVFCELPNAQHAFDILASLRCQATTAGVVAFLDAVRSRRAAAGRADAEAARAEAELGPGAVPQAG